MPRPRRAVERALQWLVFCAILGATPSILARPAAPRSGVGTAHADAGAGGDRTLAACREGLAERAAQAAWDAGYYESAQALLARCVSALDDFADHRQILELRRIIDRRRAEHARALLRAHAEAQAGSDGKKARRNALEGLLPELDPVRDEALRGELQQELADIDEELAEGVGAHLWQRSVQLVELVIQIAGCVLLLGAAVGLARYLQSRRGSSGIGLRVSDATEGEALQRLAPNPRLAACFIAELRSLEQDETGIIQVHGLTMGLLSGSALTPVLDELSGGFDDQPVSIGPLRFSPQQLVKWVGGYLRRPFERQLDGLLSREEDTYRFALDERTRPRAAVPGARPELITGKTLGEALQHVKGSSPSPNERATPRSSASSAVRSWLAVGKTPREAVRNVAIQYAIEQANSKATQNWQSLRAYLEASETISASMLLAPEARRAALRSAAEALKHALQLDPSNWLARFRYGVLLGLLDEQLLAMDQFDYLIVTDHDRWLQAAFDETLRTGLGLFGQYIARQPELPWMILYNCAVATAKVGGRQTRSINYASRALRAWAALKRNHAQIPERLRGSVEWYLDALRALACLAALECLRELEDQAPHQAKAARRWSEHGLEQIQDIEKALWANPTRASGQGVFVEAHSTAQYALGRAYYLLGRDADAVRYLRWAIEIHLPEHAVDPRLSLAEVLIRSQPSSTWAEEARRLLEEVCALRPQLGRARYLLGITYEVGPGRDRVSAVQHYRAAGAHWPARLRLARVLVDDSKAEEALDVLDELTSEAARPAPLASPAQLTELRQLLQQLAQGSGLGASTKLRAQQLLVPQARRSRPP